MILTPEQQALLNGEKGETMAKVVKTLVMYGDAFDAERMVPVTSEYGHTVISFGLKTLGPVYDLYQKLLDEGLLSKQKFTADPRPLDKNVPSSFLEDIVFNKLMYSRQASYSWRKWDCWMKTAIPAPAICLRWVMSPNRETSFPGRRVPLSSMQTPSSVPAATAIPASWN